MITNLIKGASLVVTLLCVVAAYLLLTEDRTPPSKELIKSFELELRLTNEWDIVATETIHVVADSGQIIAGIARAVPPKAAITLSQRNGEDLPYLTEEAKGHDKVFLVREGETLKPGEYTYLFQYRASGLIKPETKEHHFYWNVTGNYWTIPIQNVRARVILPRSVNPESVKASASLLTKRGEQTGVATSYDGEAYTFISGQTLLPRESMKISLMW